MKPIDFIELADKLRQGKSNIESVARVLEDVADLIDELDLAKADAECAAFDAVCVASDAEHALAETLRTLKVVVGKPTAPVAFSQNNFSA